jgi:integrase
MLGEQRTVEMAKGCKSPKRYARRGTGSARIRAGKWEIRRVIDGQRRAFRGTTLLEAQTLAAAGVQEAALAARGRSLSPTLRDWLADWLTRKRDSVRPQTWSTYDMYARAWLVPILGTVRLDALGSPDLDRLHATMLRAVSGRTARNLSRTTVRHVHLTLSAALNDAVRRGLLAANPARTVVPPRRDERRMEVLTRDEVELLLTAVRGDPFEAAYILAVTLGMREGELLGLRWEDVDLERRALRVRGNATRGFDGRRGVREPKTSAGLRTLRLPRVAVDALARTPRKGDLIWPAASGTPMAAPTFVSAWRAAAAMAGVRPVRFHALRHTAATLALEDGIQPHDVAAMLGHSTVATTLRLYAHVTDASTERLVDAIDARHGARLRIVAGSNGTPNGTQLEES